MTVWKDNYEHRNIYISGSNVNYVTLIECLICHLYVADTYLHDKMHKAENEIAASESVVKKESTMSNLEVVHKLIQPTTDDYRYLNELVLCWNQNGAPAPDQIRHTRINGDINKVTCTDCWTLWMRGIYR